MHDVLVLDGLQNEDLGRHALALDERREPCGKGPVIKVGGEFYELRSPTLADIEHLDGLRDPEMLNAEGIKTVRFGLAMLFAFGNPLLAVTVAVSMLAAMTTAALLGVLVPWMFRLLHIDPAIAAGPLVTTINDTTAISIYYVVALFLIAS